MQIVLNDVEVTIAVRQYIEELVAVPDGQRLDIELVGDDNSITAEINIVSADAPAQEASPNMAKPATGRKTRRTKAQIEADRLEEERQAALTTGKSNDTPTPTRTVQGASVSESVVVEAAGDTSQIEQQSPGTDPAEVVEQQEHAEQLAAASADEDAAADAGVEPETPVEACNEEAEPELQPEPVNETPKPTQSLFANLRRPKN